MTLDFDWERSDSNGSYTTNCGYTFKRDNREFYCIQLDDSGWEYVDEVDNNYEFRTIGIDWPKDDGLLDVSLTVWNPLGTALA